MKHSPGSFSSPDITFLPTESLQIQILQYCSTCSPKPCSWGKCPTIKWWIEVQLGNQELPPLSMPFTICTSLHWLLTRLREMKTQCLCSQQPGTTFSALAPVYWLGIGSNLSLCLTWPGAELTWGHRPWHPSFDNFVSSLLLFDCCALIWLQGPSILDQLFWKKLSVCCCIISTIYFQIQFSVSFYCCQSNLCVCIVCREEIIKIIKNNDTSLPCKPCRK